MTRRESRLVVTHVVSGDLWAGAEVQVFNLCAALRSTSGITVTAIVFNEGILLEKLREAGIPVTLADERKSGPFRMTLTIAEHCRAHGATIVHTHGFKENILGIMGKELARAPFSVRTVHGNPETHPSPYGSKKWLTQKLDLALGRFRQQAVIAVSTQLQETLEELFPGKVHRIFNFIDVDNLRNQFLKIATPNRRISLGIVGRLVSVKRVDLFIKTISLLKTRNIDCIGIIIGSGPLESELKHLAVEQKVSDLITFKGFVNPAVSEIATLDALLMTSDHEGLPMTLLEAAALEVPIVAHHVGGIPELLAEGNCGWLVEDHSEVGYANSVEDMINSALDTRQKCKSALQHLRHDFDANENVKKYLALYQKVAAG